MSKKKTKPSGYSDKPAPKPQPFVPPTIQHTEWDGAKVKRVPLFTIVDDKGEPTEYSIPAKKNAGLWLKFLRLARSIGDELASSWLLEEVIGTEGYEALCNEPDLTDETVTAISRRVAQVIGGKAPDVDYDGTDDETEDDDDPS